MDTIILRRQSCKLPWFIGCVLISIVIHAGAYYTVAQLMSSTSESLIADVRKKVQGHISRLSINYFDANLTGSLVSRVMSDVEGLRNILGIEMVQFLCAVTISAITVVVLACESVSLTTVVVGMQFIAVVIVYRACELSRPLVHEKSSIRAEVAGRLAESFVGARVVKGYHAEGREAEVFAHGAQRLLLNAVRSRTAFSAIEATWVINLGLSTLLLMVFGVRYLLSSRWTIGEYVQYSVMLIYLVSPVFQLVNIGAQFTQALASLDRIREVLSERREEDDPERTNELPRIIGSVLVEDVGFAYELNRPVLRGISFEAQPGTITALVGRSGSGKSTMISLLCAFHKPKEGRILVDGIDLSVVKLCSYRACLGLVLQDTFLFDGTIRENVLFSRPRATDNELLRACRAARVDEFAERFPGGYETIVGERGVKLSGGQRQRLSIARAILADPRILILDEATSSLDSESEAMIQEGLSYLMAGRTTFVIAHRLSTVKRADQILVLEEGRIVERGTHDSLYKLGSRYYELYTKQLGVERNLFPASS
jgi:subfamily B ATP-binding cassette protein MsbA